WTIRVVPESGVRYGATGGTEIVFFPDTTTAYEVFAARNSPCSTPPADTIRFNIVRDTSTVGHLPPITDMALCAGDTSIYRLDRRLDHFSIRPATHMQVSSDSITLRFYPPATARYQFTGLDANRCQTIRDTFDFSIRRSSLNAAFELAPRLSDQRNPVFELMNRSKGASAYAWYQDSIYWTSLASPSLTVQNTGPSCFTLDATY